LAVDEFRRGGLATVEIRDLAQETVYIVQSFRICSRRPHQAHLAGSATTLRRALRTPPDSDRQNLQKQAKLIPAPMSIMLT